MKGIFLLCFISISSIYAAPAATTTQSFSSSFDTIDERKVYAGCYPKFKGYDAVFLSAFDSYKEVMNPWLIENINSTKFNGYRTELFIELSSKSKKTPYQIVKTIYDTLKSNKISPNFMWLKIKNPKRWSNSTRDNMAYIRTFRSELLSRSIRVGFYTEKTSWEQITDNDTYFFLDPLWYGFDNKNEKSKDFSDYEKIGGWDQPTAKSWLTGSYCNIMNKLMIYVPGSLKSTI